MLFSLVTAAMRCGIVDFSNDRDLRFVVDFSVGSDAQGRPSY